MALTILFITILGVLVVFGLAKLTSLKSSIHMIDADWMDEAEKFRLVSRWGIV